MPKHFTDQPSSIRSGIDQATREAAIDEYNCPDKDLCSVLVLSSRSARESESPERRPLYAYYDFIPISITLQSVGRINRGGQRQVQIIKILTIDTTYNQFVQARESEKYIALMSGNTVLSIDRAMIDKHVASTGVRDELLKKFGPDEANKEDAIRSLAKEALIQPTLDALYRDLMGARSDQCCLSLEEQRFPASLTTRHKR